MGVVEIGVEGSHGSNAVIPDMLRLSWSPPTTDDVRCEEPSSSRTSLALLSAEDTTVELRTVVREVGAVEVPAV